MKSSKKLFKKAQIERIIALFVSAFYIPIHFVHTARCYTDAEVNKLKKTQSRKTYLLC